MAPDEPRDGKPGSYRIVSAEEIGNETSPAPPIMNVGPPTGEHELPHWTEPATGQVPAVVLGNDDTDRSAKPDAPRWRSEHDTVEHGDLIAELTGIAAESPVAERLGAVDADAELSDEEYLNFDDVDLVPTPRRSRRSRKSRISKENANSLAAILPQDLGGPSTSAPPPLPPPPPATPVSQPSSDFGGTYGEAPAAETPSASGGRNVPVAVAVGVGIAVIAALLFKAGPAPTVMLITVVLAAAGFEFFGAIQRSGFRPATLLGVVAVAVLPLATYWKGESALPAVIFLTFVFGVIWFLSGAGGSARPTANLGITLLGVIWIGVFGSYAALIVGIPIQGVSILLLAVVAAVANDVGAFFFGRSLGRSPLSAVSPNKTVEGLIGGVASTLFAVFIVAVVVGVGPFGAGKALLFALVLAVIAPLGDLAESLFKRDLGVKDMGSFIPQHGGVLDRFDALLFVLPAAYYLTRILALN